MSAPVPVPVPVPVLVLVLGGCMPLAACSDNSGSSDDGASPAGTAGSGSPAGTGASGAQHEAPPDDAVEYLAPAAHLTRASLALRGRRPSVDELDAVEQDPRYVEAIVDYYLTTPEFGATVRELHAQALLVDVDRVIYPAGFPAIGALASRDVQAINDSIVQAPLRLIEHVVMDDRPYSEIVTADYTVADDAVATVWGMPYDVSGPEWQETHYNDERPQAGILSDSFLFTRHSTTFSNKSRGRANLISNALLCFDFLSSEIPVDAGIDLADPEAVADAVRNNEACLTCHRTLDPLAAHFAGFYPIYVPSDLEKYPFGSYKPAFTEAFSAAEPGYFGQPSSDLVSLGRSLAGDPRFTRCAAKRFYSFLAQVPLQDVPDALSAKLERGFIDSGLNAKALAKAVVMSDAFRAAYSDDDATAQTLVGLRKARPSQLAGTIEALTGYRWRTRLPIELGTGAGKVGDVDLMDDAFFGFKVLAGGIDGNSVTRPSYTASATVALSLEALAARAADYVVAVDFARDKASERRLLTLVERGTDDEPTIRAQLALLELRMFGERLPPDDPAIDDALQLYQGARKLAGGNAARAWSLTLFAMLQDVRMLYD